MAKKETTTTETSTPKRGRPRKIKEEEKVNRCSFCNSPATSQRVRTLFNGIDNVSYICNSCVKTAYKILEEYNMLEDPNTILGRKAFKLPYPAEIKKFLDNYVIGQDMAKMRLSVAVYNHYKRITDDIVKDTIISKELKGINIEKSNILMIGDTGVGKTELARTIAKMLKVPFVIVDATSLTQAGYVGDDVESMLTKLLQAAKYDIKEAERGIIFIDEIDKLAKKQGRNQSITRDVSGEGVQQGLLKLLEGSEIAVQKNHGRRNPAADDYVTMNTNNILFICSGSFVGLKDIISSRLNKKTIGFDTTTTDKNKEDITDENILQYVNAEDLKQYGLIPEMLGRLPIITYLDPLTDKAMEQILTQPKNAIIKQYKKLFMLDGITLDIDDDVYPYIVEKAKENKIGARALRGITENIMTYAMFNMPSKKNKEQTLHITKEFAMQELSKFHMEKYRDPVITALTGTTN